MAILRKSPKQERSKSIFDAILLAAARILPEQGFAKSTTNKIAELAGVSIGSLYQYFPNKESLVTALLERHVNKHIKLVETKLGETEIGDIDPVLNLLIRPILEDVIAHRKLLRVISAQVFSDGGIEFVVSGRKKLVEIIQGLLEKNRQKLPESLRPLHASYLIVNGVSGLVEALIFDERPVEFQQELIDETILLVRKYLT